MPLFYCVPFKFSKDRSKPEMVEFKGSDIALYGTLAVVALVIFFALIVVPLMMISNQTLPAINVQPPNPFGS